MGLDLLPIMTRFKIVGQATNNNRGQASGSQLQVINEIITDAASRISSTNPNGISVIIRIIP
jgi:hypothetical protein